MATGAEKTGENEVQNSNIPPKPVTIHLLNMSNTSTMMPRAAARNALGRHSTLGVAVCTHAITEYRFYRNVTTGEDYGH
jgi:hypothetical protein